MDTGVSVCMHMFHANEIEAVCVTLATDVDFNLFI
jgi:hypothetical protein